MSEHRTIGIGMDYSPSSKTALKWAVENIARAGDHIVLIHTQPHESHSAQKQLWEEEGSRWCTYTFFFSFFKNILISCLPVYGEISHQK